MIRPRWTLLGGAIALVGCRDKFDATFPEAGEPEALSVLWDGAEVAGSHPSLIVDDGVWNLYFTANEGSYVGPLHATSEDGVNFTLSSSTRLIKGVVDDEYTRIDAVRVWSSGSTWHMLAASEVDGASAVGYARGSSATEWAQVSVPWQAELVPATGEPLSYGVASGDYEPGASTAYLNVAVSGDDDATGFYRSDSEDGGDTWSTPARAFGPADVPDPWSSRTAGPGGMWDATVVPGLLGGYHALFVGAAPGEVDGVGIGHASSADGETWTVDNDAWLLDEVGAEVHGLFLLDDEDGYWLYYSASSEGATLPGGGSLYRMWLEQPS